MRRVPPGEATSARLTARAALQAGRFRNGIIGMIIDITMENHHFQWENHNLLWKLTMLSMGKSTISTGPWLQ